MAIVQDASTQAPVVVYTGVTQPSLYYQITNSVDGSTVDTTGATLVFFMRALESRNPVVFAAAVALAPPDNDGHNVRYDWQASDVAVGGPYMGWFSYQLPSMTEPAETEEFRIMITDHGPGYGTETGAVVDGISMFVPITLSKMREEPTFGDRFLQMHADYVKQVVMGTVVSPDLEVDYDQFLVQYLAKRTALRIIPPALDFWGRQPTSMLTSGPAEQLAFPNELQNLAVIAERLGRELPGDWLQLQAIVPNLPQLRREPMPLSSLGDPQTQPWVGPVTKSPQETARQRTGGPHWPAWFQF